MRKKIVVLAILLSVAIAASSLIFGLALNSYFWGHTINFNTPTVFTVSMNDTIVPTGQTETINLTISQTSFLQNVTLNNLGTTILSVNVTDTIVNGTMIWRYASDLSTVTFPFSLAATSSITLTLEVDATAPSGSCTFAFTATG